MEVLEKEVRNIRGLCGEYADGKVYIYSLDFNGILEYDLERNEKKIIKGRNSAGDDARVLSTTSILYEDSIYYIHRLADSILKLSVKTYEKKEIFAEGRGNAFNPVIVKDKLLMMPQYYIGNIPCVDLKTDKVFYLPFHVSSQMKTKLSHDKTPDFYGDVCLNGFIYRACRFGEYINKYNYESCTVEFIQVNGVAAKLRDLAYDGTYFWIVSEGSVVIQWKEDGNRVLKRIDLQDYFSEPIEVSSVKYLRGKLYFLFDGNAKILELDGEDGRIRVYDPSKLSGFHSGRKGAFSQNICQDENGILYFIPRNANGILAIDTKGSMKLYNTAVSIQAIMNTFEGLQMNERMCSAGYLLNLISDEEEDCKRGNEINKGCQVWEYVFEGARR